MLTQLYKSISGGKEPSNIEKLPGAGSNRQYYRVGEYIGVIGTSAEENKSFCELSRLFSEAHLPVPKVLAQTDDYMAYIEEDLGDVSLFDAIKAGREKGGQYDESEKVLLRKTIAVLPRIQYEGGRQEVFDNCYPQKEMDRVSIMFDLNYFKYCFLKLKGVEFNEFRLQDDLEHFADDIAGNGQSTMTFLYRDFQARNVMLKDGEPYLIDFQGGRKGPIYYDVASFLWQASARYPEALRDELIDVYLDALQPYCKMTRGEFMPNLRRFVLFRLLQVLGAYGYRGLWEKKEHFIKSIPPALANLKVELANGSCDSYPYLKQVLEELVKDVKDESKADNKVAEYLANDASYLKEATRPLVVRVYSFSFKRGIPCDETSNGGGYVFDCRSTHNPGRYDEYKQLTGLDQPVIDFLEQDGEILTFLESAYKLVDFHAKRFMERGFTDLMICCGCTGGRHRSVYSAQHIAEHLNNKFGVEVRICHREQGIETVLPAKEIKN